MATKDQVLGCLDIVAFYEHSLGVPLPPGSGGWSRNILCPFHEEKTPSFGVNLRTGHFRCFGCGAKGSVFDFHMKLSGCDFKAAVSHLAGLAGVNDSERAGSKAPPAVEIPENLVHFLNRWKKALATPLPPEADDYIQRRKIGKACALLREKNMLGWDTKFQGLALPLLDWRQKNFLGIQVIPVDGSPKRFVQGSRAKSAFIHIGPLEWMRGGRRLVFAEGFADAASIYEADQDLAAAAILSASTTRKLKDVNREFVFFPDRDAAGKDAAAKVGQLPGAHIASWDHAPGDFRGKDLNDLLRAGHADLIRTMINTAKPISAVPEPGKQEVSSAPTIELVSYAEISELEIPDEPLIGGLLGKRESLIISGPSGIGKSAFSNFLTLTAGTPPATGLWGIFPIPRPLTTLVIQSENGLQAQNKRLRLLLGAVPELRKGAERVVTTKVGSDCRLVGSLEDPDFQKLLIDALQAVKADLLVIDPLISYHEADENDNGAMRRALDCLTRICDRADVSTIIFHHMNRQGQTRGASAIRDWAANMFLLEYAEGAEPGKSIIRVVHDKSRNYPQKTDFYLDRTPDLNFLLCGKPGKKSEQVQDVVQCLTALGGCVTRQKILLDALVDTYGLSQSTAYRAVKEAINMGMVESVPGGGKGSPNGCRVVE